MSKESWSEFAAYYLPKVEACLQDYLSKLAAYPRLKEAMMYSVNAGGKRIRPLLVLAAIKTLNGQLNQASLQVAASLELIHTYSLIHDDLPEMDNDDLRRGKPTNHKVFGQALAVLAGDGLLTTAFELLGQVKLPAETVVQLLNYLAYAAGPQGMVNGQVGDIEGEKTALSLAELEQVHAGKTGALLVYACQAGSVICQAKQPIQMALENYGRNFGLAFQIYDDILDRVSTEEQLGKAVNKDQAEHKNTYPGILGLDGAYTKLAQTIAAANQALVPLKEAGYDVSLLAELLEYFKVKD